MPAPRGLTAASSTAFVLAAIVNSVLHELAHATAGLAQGLTPTVSPFSVSYVPDGTTDQQIVTAAAGPVFSLVLGLVLLAVARHWGRGIVRLFWLWLTFMALMNFVGYLMIAPVAQVGDTGKVLKLLDAPAAAYVGVLVLGVAGLFALAYGFATQINRYAPDLATERQLAFRAWIIGTVVTMALSLVELLALGAESDSFVVVMMYSLAVGIFAPMQFIFRNRVRAVSAGRAVEALAVDGIHRLGVALAAIVAVAMIVLATSGGVTIG